MTLCECSKWVFECEVNKIVELDDSHIFISKIRNIQISEQLKDMNMQSIDLRKLDPVIYAPYNYFRITEKLGDCGDWEKHLQDIG